MRIRRMVWVVVLLANCFFLLTRPAWIATAQLSDRILLKWHPTDSVIALSDGHVVELYSPDFELLQQATLYASDDDQSGPFQMEWSPDGALLAIAPTIPYLDGALTIVQFLSAYDLQIVGEISGQELILGTPIAWSPDSTELAVAHWNNLGVEEVRIYDVPSGNLVASFGPPPPTNIEQLAWSPDGSQIVIGNGRELQVWDRDTEQHFHSLPGASLNAQPVFSPTENHLAFANQDAQTDIQIWDTNTGILVQTLQGHSSHIFSIIWGSESILSVSSDGTGRVWDPVSGVARTVFSTPLIFPPSWSPDGTLFATADYELGVYIRDAWTADIFSVLGGAMNAADLAPASTISNDDVPADLRRLLSGPGCQAACFLGIEPGVTTNAEVEAAFAQANIAYERDTIGLSDNRSYSFDASSVSPHYSQDDWQGFIWAGDNEDDVVSDIVLPLNGVSVGDVLSTYGPPTQILDWEAAIVLVYFNEHLVFEVDLPDAEGIDSVSILPLDTVTARYVDRLPSLLPCTQPVEICSIATATPGGD